ncbi:Lrp/AsnC family transcriptional regulator [Paenarthrobacter sp. NPDC090520]|uniref:Lrp/AsnC family transcriptional regulator n=1 Tax=Paenarthrobacter sp. NPDC090520 TaxID=3364382 RepID=UPI0038017CA3
MSPAAPNSNGASLSRVRQVAASPVAAAPLDELDLALLKELISDGRASQRTLAATLRVSAPTIGERMARLERSGVITGYSAQINWTAVGFTETVFLSVTASEGSDVAAMMSQLWEIPEVEDVNMVTGNLDLLVRIRVRDNNHLRTLLLDRIWQIPGTQGTSTMTTVAEMPSKPFAHDLITQIQADHSHQAAESRRAAGANDL